MNEFFCSKCLTSMYSAVSTPAKCPKCRCSVTKNPESEVKEHLIKFRKITQLKQTKGGNK